MIIIIMHKTCLVLVTIYSLLKSRTVQSQDIYASLSDMEPLLTTHKNIIDDLHNYINNEKMRHTILTTYLNHYRKEHEKAMADIPRYLENPVIAFKLIKRLTADLHFIEKTINTASTYNKNLKMKYPVAEDLIGAAEAMTRLRNIYRLNITELADGILNGVFSQEKTAYTESVTPMSANDCYVFGMILIHSLKDFKNGMIWLFEAYNRFHIAQDEEHSFKKVDIIMGISYGYHMLDDVTNALKWTKILLSLRPSDTFVDLVKEYEERLAKEVENRRNLDITNKMDVERIELILPNKRSRVHEIYEAACRGELEVPRQIVKRLKCRYVTENHPFLKLAPIKMEQIYLEPEVLLFHKVMSQQEIELIKELAKPNLKRVAIISSDEQPPVPFRTSKTALLNDHDSDVVARVSRRVSDFTGLSMEAAENLQVNNYGIGGYYSPHLDAENITSTRMATVLFYMSEVAQGGATVFPELGLSVFPVRGAALFWRNLLPSGEGDEATLHAACPVLRGDKWVSNKWIHKRGQELRIPRCLEYQKEDKHDIGRRAVAKYVFKQI